MKKTSLLLLVSFLICHTSFSQYVLGCKKESILKWYHSYDTCCKNVDSLRLSPIITETDSSITLTSNNKAYKHFRIISFLNAKKKVYKIEFRLENNYFRNYWLNGVLQNKHFRWRKLNEKTYVSGWGHNAVLDIKDSSTYNITYYKPSKYMPIYWDKLPNKKFVPIDSIVGQ